MQTSRTLKPLANLATQKEQSAARSHGNVLREYQQQQQQLDELIKYRNQYIQRFQQATRTGLPIEQMRDYQLFISRLDSAIAQQRGHITEHQQSCEDSQVNLKDMQGRRKMINRVVEKRHNVEQHNTSRREQREVEDRVALVNNDIK